MSEPKTKTTSCPKCGRPTRLESEFYGWTPPSPNGPADWPVHVWNGWVDCNKSPAPMTAVDEAV